MAFKWFKKKKKDPETPATRDSAGDNLATEPDVRESSPPSVEDMEPEHELPEDEPDTAGTDVEETPTEDLPEIPVEEEDKSPPKKRGLLQRLKRGLSKTRDILTTDIEDLFGGKHEVDEDLLEELEELLITSDMGVQTSMDLMKIIRKKAAKIGGPDELKAVLKEEILKLLEGIAAEEPERAGRPHVVMVIGVNGVGKTTTIGKLASRCTGKGQRVLIAAADTFRAAAVEQLAIWAERAGADLVRHKENADPAAVAFDGMEAAMAREMDTVFVDTAGRLHTKVNLMEELKKIQRTIAKKCPDAPHEVLLVLDATTGQNALSQAKLFNEAMGITGLVLTKLDGTAKGGIVISICQSLNIPLHYIGVGEGIEDLQPFDPVQFVEALF